MERRDERIYQAYLDDQRNYGTISWERIRKTLSGIRLSERRMREIVSRQREANPPAPPVISEAELSEGTKEQLSFVVGEREATASGGGDGIQTLDQLLDAIRASGADLDPWQVRRHEVTVWGAGRKEKIVDMEWVDGVANGHVRDTGGWSHKDNWRVKAWFEPRCEQPLEQAIDDIITRAAERAPRYAELTPHKATGEHLFVVNVYDAHAGKLSADGSYTIEQAAGDYLAINRALAARALASGKSIGRVLLPIGHDLFQVDTLSNTTTAGTWVQTSGDIRHAINAIYSVAPEVVELWAAIAPVDVFPIPGNHDRLLVHGFGHFLRGWFRNHPNVTVHLMEPGDERSYYQYERVGIGMTHERGKPERLALMMPLEQPQMWAATTWREWLTGHLHTRQQAAYVLDEVGGVVMRTIPALCPPDNWHVLRMFVGNHRAAQGLYYHGEYGPAGDDVVFIEEVQRDKG